MLRDWIGLIITVAIILSLFGVGFTILEVYYFCSALETPQWLIFVGFISAFCGGRSTAKKIPVSPFLLMVVTGVLAVLTAFFPLATFWLYTGESLYLSWCLLVIGSGIMGASSLLGTWWCNLYADQKWLNRIQYSGYSHTSLMLSFILALFIGLIFPSIGFVRIGFVWLPCFLFLMLVWMDIQERSQTPFLVVLGVIVMSGWGWSSYLVSLSEEYAYPDSIIVRDGTIVVTKDEEDIRLYRNGNLRFSSVDSYRYYETLVHVPSTGNQTPIRNVLVLGAEGGLLIQEVLKYETVTHIDVVEHFETASLVQKTSILRQLNHYALDDKRVQIHDIPLFDFVSNNPNMYDAVFMDLPESGNSLTAQYYEYETFVLLLQLLKKDGFLVTQAGSPFFSPYSFWGHVQMISSLDKNAFVYPYHANVPSFGEWGFVILSRRELIWDVISLPTDVRFLTKEVIPLLFSFSNDMRVSESG